MVHLTPSLILCVAMWSDYLFFSCVNAKDYPLKYQPEFDRFDIQKYIKNERLMRLQFECLIFDGPCDIVGKFVKPRAKAALENGECLKCTPFQENLMVDFLKLFKERFPVMYKAAVDKFVVHDGAEIPAEEKARLKEAFKHDSVTGFLAGFDDLLSTIPHPDARNDSAPTEAPLTTTLKPADLTTIAAP